MTDQEQLLGMPVPLAAERNPAGVVPEQRGPGARESYAAPDEPSGAARLRVDARRNLESVLRAARQVFGELGYGAPMEEVARRAGVGVGTVYRRFPSKEVLVQRIAAEEVAWLTAQAKESLYGASGPWEALAGYLSRAVGSGAGRLLPPSAFRYAEELATFRDAAEPQVPEQVRRSEGAGAYAAEPGAYAAEPGAYAAEPGAYAAEPGAYDAEPSGRRAAEPGAYDAEPSGRRAAEPAGDADPRQLLHLLAALVARAGAAGELRPGVTVADVVLVLTAAVPVHARAAREEGAEPAEGQLHDAPADRLLQILLHGLRAR